MTRVIAIWGVVCVALGVGVVAGLRALFGGLFSDLTSDKVADLATFGVLFAVGVVLLVRAGDLLGALIWRGRQSAPRAEPPPAIDTAWRELPTYQPPAAQLPQPRRIHVPVYSQMGKVQPVGAEARDVVLETTTQDDAGRSVTLEVPYRYLLRFASLKTPSRSEWTGKPQMFYRCQRFFDAHGFMQQQGQTLVWREEYPVEARRQWLYQFEQASPTPSEGAGAVDGEDV